MSKEITAALTPEQEALLNQNLDVARKVNATAQEIAASQGQAMQLLGQVQALDAMNQYTGVGITLALKTLKDSGGYKEIPIIHEDGTVKTGASFEEFCASLGKSASKVYEDIQNLSVLGEDFMRASEQIGLSYRQLRALRRLPEDARKALSGEALPDDADELKDMVEEALVKQAEADKQLKEAKLNEEAKNKVLDKKNKALDKVQEELARLKNIPPKEAVKIQREKEIAALKELHEEGLTFNGAFTAYLAKARGILEEDEASPHTKKLVHELTSGLCSMFTQELLDAGLDIDLSVLIYPASMSALLGAEAVTPEAESEA